MKRFVAGLVLAAAFLTPCFAHAQGAKPIDLYFRTYNTSSTDPKLHPTERYVDSLTYSMNGAIGTTGTVDTTTWISTDGWDWAQIFDSVNTTANGAIKLWVFGDPVTSVDTIFVAMETSPDGSTPIGNATFSNMIVTTAADKAVGLHFQADTDAGNLNLWYAPYIRFRFRADGNTGAIATLRARLMVPILRPDTYETNLTQLGH